MTTPTKIRSNPAATPPTGPPIATLLLFTSPAVSVVVSVSVAVSELALLVGDSVEERVVNIVAKFVVIDAFQLVAFDKSWGVSVVKQTA